MKTVTGRIPVRARIPGYRAMRDRVARSLGRSPFAVRVAHAVTGTGKKNSGTPAMGIRPGRYFADGDARHLPVVVIVATDVGDGDADRLAREIEHVQMITGSFRPLFVVDSADFAPFRSRGYVVERVMRPSELAAANPLDSYSEYLYSRVRSIARDYGASSVVPIPPGTAGTVHGMTARLVGAVAAR